MPIHDVEARLERIRISTSDRSKSKRHLDRAETANPSTNPSNRAQKSEMEEMRLELELMKKQVRALMGLTSLNTKSPVAETSRGALSDSTRRAPAKPAAAAGIGYLSQEYTELGVTGGSAGGGYESGLVLRYLLPSDPPQTPRDREMEKLKVDPKKETTELEDYKREVKHLQQDMRTQVMSNNALQFDRQRLSEANSGLCQELLSVKKELEMFKALSDMRGRELLGVPKFLTKADSISISDLKEKVVALNDEISQAAASLRGTITHQSHGLTEEDASRMYGEVLLLIGEPLAVMLAEESRKPNADSNPLLAQVVLQVFMTQVCASKIELWVPNDPKISDFFAALYTNIQSAEGPAVYGRWRALTKTHTRPDTQGWKEGLISSLMSIMMIAAWKMPDKDQRLSFEGKLVPIFKAVEDLRIAIGEKITSADIRVFLVPPLSRLNTDFMDDAFADSDARVKVEPSGAIRCVVGTTGFGLKKVINGKWGPSGELLYESLLLPKVILESTLRAALKPIDSLMCGKT